MSRFIDANRERLGVEPICREIEVSASAYRARRTRPPSSRALRDAFLLAQIRRVHAGCDGIYGQLKVWDDLNDECGDAALRQEVVMHNGHMRTLDWLIGRLWNCTDIMPGSLCDQLDLLTGSTYAQGVRSVKGYLRR